MRLAVLALLLCLEGLPSNAASWPLPRTSPDRAGFSTERLGRLDAYCEDLVASGRYSGLTVLLARDGRIVHWASHGFRDRASTTPLARDDVFAIASLTKIVTTVSALILVEEGKLTLREPIGRYLPEFNAMKVLVGGSAAAPVLTDAIRPITLHHLLTHTAGFSSFDSATAPLFAEMRKLRSTEVSNLQEMARSLATFPLQSQPGDAWVYGPSTDLVGALVEKVSGQPFDWFVEERILRPLGMKDTSFEVPISKRSRQVSFDIRQPDGSLVSNPPKPRGPSWPSGGGGLYSTVADYVRFAQMLLNGGELDGVRILSPKTVDLMRRDHLHGLAKPTKIYPVSDGFGYGVEVRTDVARSQWLGTQGTFGWNGSSTAYCSIDPGERLIAMIWAQHSPNAEFELYERFNNLVYQALIHPAVR
jgi:CubicO group peptidase (beta-lactamase class C family)